MAQAATAAALKRRLEEEDRSRQAKAEADILERGNSVVADSLEGLGKGLELLEMGAIAWRTATPKRSAGIGFGSMAPADAEEKNAVVQTVKSAGPWLQRIAKLVHATVNAVLGRERQKLAKDAEYIAAARAEMGLAEDPHVESIRLRMVSSSRSEQP